MEKPLVGSAWAAKHIADLIRESSHTVVFTGAGMSTESGLPDFRSNGGLWDGKDPMEISHADMLKKDPGSLASFYAQRARDAIAHAPNKGHSILAEWEAQEKIWGIATQNIDGYHQRAGSKNILELHGNLDFHCIVCQKEYTKEEYTSSSSNCCTNGWAGEVCGGFIRPNVTLFGETLPERPYHRALSQFSQAKLCIILGSSCSVHPANSLPQHTVGMGGQIIIINRTSTELDSLASYMIRDWSISKALEEINKLL